MGQGMAESLNVTIMVNDIEYRFKLKSALRQRISISVSTSKSALRQRYWISFRCRKTNIRYRWYRFDIVFKTISNIVQYRFDIVFKTISDIVQNSISFRYRSISFSLHKKNRKVSRIFSRSCDVREIQEYSCRTSSSLYCNVSNKSARRRGSILFSPSSLEWMLHCLCFFCKSELNVLKTVRCIHQSLSEISIRNRIFPSGFQLWMSTSEAIWQAYKLDYVSRGLRSQEPATCRLASDP